MNLPAVVDKDYDDFIDKMERARLAYQRGRVLFHDGIPDFDLTNQEKFVRDPHSPFGFRHAAKNIKLRFFKKSSDPLPLDLKAYIVAKTYDPKKRTYGKILPELAKHKDQLHPYIQRYIIERMRQAEDHHRKLAEQYGNVADQFA